MLVGCFGGHWVERKGLRVYSLFWAGGWRLLECAWWRVIMWPLGSSDPQQKLCVPLSVQSSWSTSKLKTALFSSLCLYSTNNVSVWHHRSIVVVTNTGDRRECIRTLYRNCYKKNASLITLQDNNRIIKALVHNINPINARCGFSELKPAHTQLLVKVCPRLWWKDISANLHSWWITQPPSLYLASFAWKVRLNEAERSALVGCLITLWF